ncbi:MFS transporter [Escherichia coli]
MPISSGSGCRQSLYRGRYGITVAAGAAFDRIGRRPVLITGALIFTFACAATMLRKRTDTVSYRACNSGRQYLFYCSRWLCQVQSSTDRTKGIKLMAIITSIVLIAPIIGPLSGAALMHFVHWKVAFAIIAIMGFISFVGLLLAMPETVKRGAVPFSAKSVLRDFRNVFCNRLLLFGAATISLSYIPMMSWVAVCAGDPDRRGRLNNSQFAWTQVPVFGAVIVANAQDHRARFVKIRPNRALSGVPYPFNWSASRC